MSSAHPIESGLAHAWPPQAWQDVTVLLAISGGADSVALLRAMLALKTGGQGRLCAAHFNHQLRGHESAADEAFVVGLCRQFAVSCEVGHAPIDRIAADTGRSTEAGARSARYDFLRRTAARLGARYVVTAHTADDQAETILHRVIRGTGIAGLAGMARARALGPATTLIRPLLAFRRRQLLAYLDHVGQPYRHDSSNDDTRFTRNRIRRQLMPQLAREFNPGVVEALLRLGALAGEAQNLVDRIVCDLAARCVASDDCGAVRIDIVRLVGQPRYVIRELLIATWGKEHWPLQAMGFSEWDSLADMILASAGAGGSRPRKRAFPGQILAEVHQGLLTLSKGAG